MNTEAKSFNFTPDTVIMVAESPPEYTSGVGQVVNMQKKLLQEEGIEVIEVYPTYTKHPNVSKRQVRLPSWKVPFKKDYRIAVPWCVDYNGMHMIREKMQKLKDDHKKIVVHLQGPHYSSDLVGRVAQDVGLPILLQLHTDDYAYIDTRTPWYLNWLKDTAKSSQARRSRLMADRSLVVTAPSHYYAEKFSEITGYDKKVKLFPTITVPPESQSQEHLAKFRRALLKSTIKDALSTREIISSVGRLAPEKNVAFLIEIMAELKKIRPDNMPLLLIAGGGDERYVKKIKTMIRDGKLNNDVILLGQRDRNEVLDIFRISSLTLLPSTTETQGLVGDEARLCGSLPLVNRGTALAERMHFPLTQLWLKPKAIAWAEKIDYLLRRPEKVNDLKKQAIHMAREQNNINEYKGLLLGYYAKCLK